LFFCFARRSSLSRYNLIIKKLRRAPASFSEIMDYMERESELQGEDFVVSKQTFKETLMIYVRSTGLILNMMLPEMFIS
jgi:hypothetical protein